MNDLQWKKFPVLNDGFICLVDVMGTDESIVQAARVSYGKDERNKGQNHPLIRAIKRFFPDTGEIDFTDENFQAKELKFAWGSSFRIVKEADLQYELIYKEAKRLKVEETNKDRNLIRYLLAHSHTTPFEMCEVKFLVRVPMDCWRQWIRHRTANVNEYSTRYTEAIDCQQTTSPGEWRLQATDNKQGSSGYLMIDFEGQPHRGSGARLTQEEVWFHENARKVYQERLRAGVAKEQARKDLPLSTYTEAYWKCDLHNILNFLRLRMDSHAQYEIRMYANAMAEIVKQLFPVTWEAFEDYVLQAKKFSRMEMEVIRHRLIDSTCFGDRPDNMTDREWKAFLEKLQ